MRKLLSALGWTLAIVGFVAAGVFYTRGQRQVEETARLEDKVTRLQQDIAQFGDEVEKDKATIDRLGQTVAELEALGARAAADRPDSEETEDSGEDKSSADGGQGDLMAKLMELGKGLSSASAGTPKDGNPLAPFMKMFEGESGKQMTDMSAHMAVNMHYRDLFESLNLPEDTEQIVRDILKRHLSEQITLGLELMQEGFDAEKAGQMEADAQANLRNELSAVLTPDEMTVFDEYAATLPERMMRQSFEMQLGMFTPGLSEEHREMVCDVMVEEYMATALGSQTGSGLAGFENVEGALDMQREALERARERVATVLEPEQFEQVDRFFKQQEQMLGFASMMMGGGNAPASDSD